MNAIHGFVAATLAVSLAAGAQAADGRYIVQSSRGADHAAAAAANAGGQVALELRGQGAVAAYLPARAADALSRNPNLFVEEDARRYPLADDFQEIPYGVPMVQADQVVPGAGKTVCIIDSGYDLGHPDLQQTGVTGENGGGAGDWSFDGCGHGTHVAGTIAGLDNGVGVVGVVPDGSANLHIVRVFGDDCGWAYSSSLVAALEECEAAGADVINMSLGGSRGSRTEDQAFAAAYGRGVLSIAAAGNDGNTRKSYPASYDSVVSVAAVDAAGRIADFSQQNSAVELAAPGVGVDSTVPRGHGQATTLTVGGTPYRALAMEGSPFASATGPLVGCDVNGNCGGAAPGHVCLIPRGDIAFSDKVLGCEAGGGAAAVIYNNTDGDLLGTLADVVTSIPSMGITQADGATLLGLVGAEANASIGPSDYGLKDGTSMATPHVVGVAALVWSKVPTATNQEIRDALAATALDLGAAGRDDAYGFGLVQAADAVSYLESGPSCTPTEQPETTCDDGQDNDCDGLTDADDDDCASEPPPPPPVCDLGQVGDACTDNADCCSNNCKGKRGAMTCK